jgi:hypothetical protein
MAKSDKTCSTQTVDEVMDSLPKEERVIAKRLRAIILENLPFVTEKNSYGVPFYTRNRMMCFIWPPSISWGPKKDDYKQKGVTLGFCQGYLFANDDGSLLAEGRKQVYCMYFTSVAEIDEEKIKALLFEAEMIDNSFKKKKKKS